jgi:RNA polymerase sigma factor (sigma-70 family)
MTNKRSSNFSSSDLLARLRTDDGNAAWQQFLDVYSPVIIHVAAQYEHHPDARNDCYLYVCEKLSDNGFRRILSFQPEGSASLRSWLNVVVANLCIDWKRQNQGRVRPFKSIKKLSTFDQIVFKYRFQQRMSLQTCLASMQAHFPGVNEIRLASSISRLNETLTQKQLRLLRTRRTKTISLDQPVASGLSLEPSEPGPDPEQLAALSQERDKLQQALSRLSPRHRLLIKLRYQQELSLKEVARLTRLGDPFRARRHIQAALDALTRYFES